jgi:V8-like Glu-specific endopeptidase
VRRKRIALWSVASGIGVSAVLAATLLAPAQAAVSTRPQPHPGTVLGVARDPDPDPAAPDPDAVALQAPQQSGIAQYWTAARMASATSEDTGAKGVPLSRYAPQTTVPDVTAARLPSAYVNGRPSIGIVFFRGRDLKTHFCTAFVVNSRTRNLIMMAAHCRPGTSQAFVPGYRIHGATVAPYGIWPLLRSYTDRRFSPTGSGTDFDYAFAKVGRNAAGRQIQDVTHGNTLATTPAYANTWVGVTGYPKTGAAPADRPVTCWAPTRRLAGYPQMEFLCNGYYGGTSGSPWLIHYLAKTNTGTVIGLIGGVGGGGPNAWTSYSPMFDRNTIALYAYAVAH